MKNCSFGYGSSFRREGGAEEDSLDEDYFYINIGDKAPNELKKSLMDMVQKAQKDLNDEGTKRLSKIMQCYPVFRLRLEKYRPAEVPLMRVRLKTSA